MSLTRRTSSWLLLFGLLLAALLRLPALTTVPPGVHYDEAANGILAAEIASQGEHPIFIASYTGKEVLFFYGAGLLARLVGPGAFSLRLTAAFLGLLTVAATYWLGRVLRLDRRIALVAALLLATSFWHLLFSRLGFRAISQPLLQALAVGFIWTALPAPGQAVRWRRVIVAGICLGLVAYTYLAARLFPVALFIGLLPFLNPMMIRPWRRHPQVILAAIGIVALLVLAPLLSYFLAHPDAFWVRISQVGPTDSLSLGESYQQSLSMLFLKGDPYWRFNLPDRPVFGTIWGAFLIIGWLLALYQLIQTKILKERAALLLLVTLPFIMILPTALATNEIVPSNLRAIGLLPFIVFLPAYGFVQLLDSLAAGLTRWQAQAGRWQIGLLLLLGLLMAGWTAQLYFGQWAQRVDVFYETEADLSEVAAFLNEREFGDSVIYVASPHYRHPSLALQARLYDQLKWLPESQAIAIPDERDAWYVFPHASPQPEWTQRYLQPAETVTGPLGPDGAPTFVALFVPATDAPADFSITDGNFGYQANLLELAADRGVAGGSLPVTLAWRIIGQAGTSFLPFLHLVDESGRRWSQLEPFAYPSEQWSLGETVIIHLDMPVPAGAPPQPYELRAGFFASDSGQQLPRLDNAGRYIGTQAILANINIAPGPLPNPLPIAPVPLDREVMAGLWLTGYERDLYQVGAGDTVGVALWWLNRAALPDFLIRLELVRPDNTGIILGSSYPVNGTYPPSTWSVPQFLIDHIKVQVPITVEAGNYRLRLRVLDPGANSIFLTDLGPLSVEASEREFTAPRVETPLAAVLGEEINLRGYDLDRQEDGRYLLRLVWQAERQPAGDYTVFVHLLDRDGSCCLWQADLMPRQGSYPTSSWLQDEVVVDEYLIELPADLGPGEYQLEVGLFIADSGVRLLVQQPGLPVDDKLYLRPIVILPTAPDQ
ncbi:MAG: phospholipid carrier-dependent glycosyltransferase [Anaerolineales bacterium]|nr:phospholipid carrier-dependent glycosyltransferase [Anaerolineales bacterium]